MYIKTIVLDGFKSYGQRTEIAGFDQLFNAITGLNGSGKSNILDAICFALGLSNMSLARCSNLRELIFKNGNAGVHKAVVTVTFDNTDKAQSPTGYEQMSEIIIRREVHLNSRTKYYICGQSASNSQGRITKVLNMKPHDILAMIEEATGVSMYEVKKRSTQGMIEKKDHHLKSIDDLIGETILPKLNQLRKEHENLLEYQNLVGQLEKFSKQFVAWQFTQYQQKADRASDRTDKCNRKITTYETQIEELEAKQDEISDKIKAIEQHNDELSGGRIAELEEALKEEEKEEIKETGKLDKLTDSLNEDKKKKTDVEKQLNKDDSLRTKKEAEFKGINDDFRKIEDDYTEADYNLVKAQKDYEAVVAGKAINEEGGAATSLAEQLIKAEEEYNSSNTEMKIAKTKLTNCQRDLVEKKAEANKHKAQYDEDNKHIAALEKNVNSIKARLDAISYSDSEYNSLQNERDECKTTLKQLAQQLSGEEASARLNFEYSPIPGFNPNCVKGPICKLFELKDPKYARAVEAAAGGRLYDIAIETNDQCKEILDKGNLKRRHNLIALNKVQGRPVDRCAVDAAQKIANDKEVIAVQDLIEFDPSLKSAMNYVFGDTMVAPNVDKAMKITYSHLKKRTVTLDGDIIMPGGDMSGGAVSKAESFLVTLMKLKSKFEQRNTVENKLRSIELTLASMEEARKEYMSLSAEHTHHSSKLEAIRSRLQLTSTHHKLFEAIKQLEKDIEELQKNQAKLRELNERSSQRMKDLRTKLDNKEQSHKRELEAAEKRLATAKKQADNMKKLIDQRRGKVESLGLEIEDLKKSCEQYQELLKKLTISIEDKQAAVGEQAKVVDQIKDKVREVTCRLKEQKNKLREQNDEINKLSKRRDRMGAEINDKRLEIKKVRHEVEQINNEARDASQAAKTMLKKYDWISQERHLFGKDNSDYPFNREDFDIEELNAQVQKLQSTKNVMQKTVNQRANVLLSDKEKEAEELRAKRSVIEEDKYKLIKYMEEVDRKKKDALHKAWQKINIDFDSIFSTFLPNTHAKLDLVPGKDLLDGLEVKVAFGSVWKESLTELSGGQRSLVALSLILALLKYNPAPLYILDEVDAALDQNHTQNTGTMIKKHFNKSQFIIVSLKDDMFRNANVLFKTKFVEGKSTVARYTRGQ